MAAANTDKFMEVGDPGTATTLSVDYTIADPSITVGATTGWPSTTGVTFAIDEVTVIDGVETQTSGTYNEFVGTVASGTSITNVSWVRGSGDRNYSGGALTRVYIPVSSERENRLAQGMYAEHKQLDGSHSDITADTIVVADGGTLDVDTINEATAANGVTIDGLSIKDSKLVTSNSVVTANITDDAVTDAKRPRLLAAKAVNTTGTAITTSTNTKLPFADADAFDAPGWHSTSTNNTRITVDEAGLYLVVGNATFPGVAAGTAILTRIYLNGSTIVDSNSHDAITGVGDYVQNQSILVLTASDYIELEVWHNKGSNETVTGTLTVIKLSD